jgi:hypothetical protein
VVALGGSHATSGINGIGGVDQNGMLLYSGPIRIEFSLPSSPSIPAVTDFVSIRSDLIANGGHPITLEAFNVNGGLLGSMTRLDNQPWTLSVANPGIHSVRISQAPVVLSAEFDDFSFNPVVAVPEPSTALLSGVGALVMLGFLRRGKS